MRTPVVAGNWKMNTTLAQASALARAVSEGVESITGVTTIVCPPSVSLVPVSMALNGSKVFIGAQDVSSSPQGAHTGELSADMLYKLCSYVIVGHSERRSMYGEDDATTVAKAQAALAVGLRPIVCVGESLAVRDAGKASEFVASQIAGSLDGILEISQVAIAYEPVWAIGTGRAASPEIAQEMASTIRAAVASAYTAETAENIPILYGGSVNANNAASFAASPDVDGALVGGASLDGEAFPRIVEAFAASD
ncbi:MAG: triose-phosphate isomerase [Dehalococcoidia bacterium]|jgi:triosephosphate isomerase